MKKHLVEKIPLILAFLAILVLGWVILQLMPKSSPEANLMLNKGTPALDNWLIKLAKAENCPLEGKIDTNGKKSYSHYCFQEETWIRFASSTRIAPYSENRELMNWLGDKQAEDEVARYIIFNQKDGWKHWRTSVKKIGNPPK